MEMKDLLEYPYYDSPIVVNIIDTMAKQIAKDIDNSVANAIHKVGIDIDKDKFVSAMKQDKERYEEAYRRGFESGYNKRDSDIIRCKDCKHATMTSDGKMCKYCEMDTDDFGYPRCVYHDADWFCSDGQRRDED